MRTSQMNENNKKNFKYLLRIFFNLEVDVTFILFF